MGKGVGGKALSTLIAGTRRGGTGGGKVVPRQGGNWPSGSLRKIMSGGPDSKE